jgi:putative peptidoglycan lipid II flippase
LEDRRLPKTEETRGDRVPARIGAAQAALYGDGPPEETPRLDRLRKLVRTALPKNAVILAILLLVGAGMSFLNLRILGHSYGAGPELDAWSAAMRLPQLALDFLVVGGVVGPFLPVFIGLKGEEADKARDFARTILTLAILAMAVAMAIMFVFAEQTLSIVAPGFTGVQREDYIGLFRVLCFAQVLFAASWVLGEILVAERRFIAYGLSEPMYYGGIAAGALLLSGPLGIYGAAVGAVFGAGAHLGIRLVGIYRTSFRPLPSLALRTKGLGEFFKLMGPKMLSQPLLALTALYFTGLASRLAPGSVTSFTFAQHFQSLPESLCGVAFATAAFPALSSAVAAGDKKAFKRVFTTNLATIAFLSISAAVGLLVFGPMVIRVLLGGGAFDATDVAQTTMVALILAVSIPFESLTELLARAIYATHNTMLPTAAAIAGFVATVLAATALSDQFGLAAIPTGYAIGMATKLAVLAVALGPRMARIGGASRPAQALVRDGRGALAPQKRRSSPATNAVLAMLLVALAGGAFVATTQALNQSTLAVDPLVTPWARVQPSRPPASRPPVITPTPFTPLPILPDFGSAVPTYSIPPKATPGTFVMDLYKEGDYVEELKNTWCVPAAMQTSMNIMDSYPDVTRDTQAKLFDLAVSLDGGSYGGANPEGWAEGLTQLGYGRYKVAAKAKMDDAIQVVVKQIRITQRPAGLIVWSGWHAWVVSGFTASADPATTDNFKVLSLRIEDVWYDRVSTLHNQSRGGHSRPPDSDVPYGEIHDDFDVWHQGKIVDGREGLFVYVIPY